MVLCSIAVYGAVTRCCGYCHVVVHLRAFSWLLPCCCAPQGLFVLLYMQKCINYYTCLSSVFFLSTHTHTQFHPWVLLPDSLQADALGVRVGQEQQGYWQQPSWLPPLSLREGPDAVIGSIPWLLHGACPRVMELQLHGLVGNGA